MDRVAIIIPSWNGASLLRECLKSIAHQTCPAAEVLVVDNGSIDNTESVVADFAAYNVQYLALGVNTGFGSAVNFGIKHSSSELVLVLNNDTVLAPECLEQITRAADEYTEIAAFAPLILRMDRPHEVYAAGLMFSDRGYGNRSNRLRDGLSRNPCEVMGVCAAAAMFRRSVLKQVGMFNERFFLMYEDQELSLRHRLLGHKCLLIPAAVVLHSGSATLKNTFAIAVAENVKNSLITLLTCAPRYYLCSYFRKIAWFYWRLFISLCRAGYSTEVVRGVVGVIICVRYICSRRHALQRERQISDRAFDLLLFRDRIHVNLPGRILELD
jgi:GT2 family glycosyltransferase